MPALAPPAEMEQPEKVAALQREELQLARYAGKGGQALLRARLAEIRLSMRRLMYPGHRED